jgi:hypothetical protein
LSVYLCPISTFRLQEELEGSGAALPTLTLAGHYVPYGLNGGERGEDE